MKINRNVVKASIALVIAIAVIVLTISWVMPVNYSGSELKLPVGRGTLSITNDADHNIPVMLVGTGPELFQVSSEIPGAAGTSLRSSMGVAGSHQLTFGLPPGTHELMVTNSKDVNLYAWGTGLLSATVHPMSAAVQLAVVAVSFIITLAVLFYASSLIYNSLLRGYPTLESPADSRVHLGA